jgi:hypothetical protein
MDAASFTVDSEQKISAVLGLGSSGIITVTSTYGLATKEGFVYFPAPTITHLIRSLQRKVSVLKSPEQTLQEQQKCFWGKAPALIHCKFCYRDYCDYG